MTWQNGKSGLSQTNLKSCPGGRIQHGFAQTVFAIRSFALKNGLFIAVLLAATLLVYQPAWQGGFIWDDDYFVTRPELLSWYGLFRIWFDLGTTLGYYPLLHSAFWVQYWLWGDVTPGYHLVNILLHGMAAVMVALILRRLAIPGAFLAAAIFALHPVHVESVAWISELKNTFSAVFYLGSAMVYLRFDQQRRTSLYFWALGLFVLSMLSKPVTATLPAALLVIFWWQRGCLSWRKDVVPLLPFFLFGVLAGILTYWTQPPTRGPEFAITALERILIAGKAIWFYLGKLFWPTNLTFIYPRWETSQTAEWQYLFPAAAFTLLVGLWALRRRWRGPLAGLLFFVGTLFPVLGFLNVFTFIYSFVADHYQYLASLGIITLTAAGFATLLKRLRLWRRPAGYAICLLLLMTLAVLTWRQSRMYTDIETLYQTTIERNPSCWMAHNNLGILLADEGRVDEAISHFQDGIRIRPVNPEALNNLAGVLAGKGRVDEAISHFQKALRIRPDYPEALNNLAGVLAEKGRLDEAISLFQDSLRIKPGSAIVHSNLGLALAKRGKLNEAITHFEKALQINPDFPEARRYLETVRSKQNNQKRNNP